MRRVMVAGLVLALAGTLTPARAEHAHDFELPTQACATAVGSASVAVTQSGATLDFRGTVVCNGATSVSITSLSLTPRVPSGPTVSGGTASCGPCGPTPNTAVGSAPASSGIYRVHMTFTAVGPGGTYANLVRQADYVVSGSATVQPARLCEDPAHPTNVPPGGPPNPPSCNEGTPPPPAPVPRVAGCSGAFTPAVTRSCDFTLPSPGTWIVRVEGVAAGAPPALTVSLHAGDSLLATCYDSGGPAVAACRAARDPEIASPAGALTCTASGTFSGVFRCEAVSV